MSSKLVVGSVPGLGGGVATVAVRVAAEHRPAPPVGHHAVELPALLGGQDLGEESGPPGTATQRLGDAADGVRDPRLRVVRVDWLCGHSLPSDRGCSRQKRELLAGAGERVRRLRPAFPPHGGDQVGECGGLVLAETGGGGRPGGRGVR